MLASFLCMPLSRERVGGVCLFLTMRGPVVYACLTHATVEVYPFLARLTHATVEVYPFLAGLTHATAEVYLFTARLTHATVEV